MAEETIEALVMAIDSATQDYWPGAETRNRIVKTRFAAIIGPYATGKNAAISAVRELEPDAHKVRSFTTRPQRPGEPDSTYYFYRHDAPTLQRLLAAVTAGGPVQADLHPSGFVYGSEAPEYEHDYTLLDILAAAVPKVRRLRPLFRSYAEIGLIATPEEWWPRARERHTETTAADIAKRQEEAVFSLGWMLDQGPDFPWVVNRSGQLPATARQILAVINGESCPDPAGRRAGEALLRSIQTT